LLGGSACSDPPKTTQAYQTAPDASLDGFAPSFGDAGKKGDTGAQPDTAPADTLDGATVAEPTDDALTDEAAIDDTAANDATAATDLAELADLEPALDLSGEDAISEVPDTAVDLTDLGGDATNAVDAAGDVSPGSCAGKCGKYDGAAKCQCDPDCAGFGDCCPDFEALCGGACKLDNECDDLNPCTDDACLEATCVHKGNGTCCKTDPECDDQNPCTTDQCTSSGCKHALKTCDDGLPCTADACDPANGKCSNVPVTGMCAIDGACQKAGQGYQSACLVCDPAQNPTGWTAKVGANCDDGSPCTEADACDAKGACTGKPKPSCCKSDADCKSYDPCMVGACSKSDGACGFTAKPQCCTAGVCCDTVNLALWPLGTQCGSTLLAVDYACNGNNGQQREGFPGCDGQKPSGCSNAAQSLHWTPWKTVVACTAAEKCVLSAGPPPICQPLQPKTCQLASNCGDGNPCTDDSCDNGKCLNLPKKCPDGPACEQGVCDAKNGKCVLVPKAGQCKIAGQCMAEGTKKPGDRCLACQTSKSTSNWTVTAACACSSGPCCDVAAGKWKPQGQKCGTDVKATQYACSPDGKSVESRAAYSGCSGSSGACSAAATDYAWEPWKTWKVCAAGTACEVKDPTQLGSCTVGADPLCSAKDEFESGTSVKTAYNLGTFDDTAAQKTVSPKLVLGSATDQDVLRWTVLDGVNGMAPKAEVTWAGAGPATVCLYAACSQGTGGKGCQAVTCPTGTNAVAHPDVSGVNPNGCCITAAAALLSWTPKVAGTWDATTTVFASVTNASSKCQQVQLTLEFGQKLTTPCTPGTTCCEPSGQFSPKQKSCGVTALAADYKCDSMSLGGKVLVRQAKAGCTGTGPTCASAAETYAWSDWTVIKACAANEKCEIPGPGQPGVCKASTQCPPGTTCCTSGGDFAAKGSKCGSLALKSEYKCADTTTKGGKLYVRKQYAGCTGNAQTCSSAPDNVAWSDWYGYSACPASEACVSGATDKPPSCDMPVPANLCDKYDPHEATESIAMARDLGSWKDTDAALWIDPKVHLKSATDKDFFKAAIEDVANLSDPKPTVEWSAPKPVTVCLYFRCTNGAGGKDCANLACPAGATNVADTAVSNASVNGCCLKTATGVLSISPDAPGNTDDSGTAFLTVQNGDLACQEVAVKVGFGGSMTPVCDPAKQWCCRGNATWAKKGTACGSVQKTEYQCSKPSAGGLVQSRPVTGSCQGGGVTCLTNQQVAGAWTTYAACTGDEWCSAFTPDAPGTCKAVVAGSCLNACGGKSKDGVCRCDGFCAINGDCLDKASQCGG
jgi:hypothetical protein